MSEAAPEEKEQVEQVEEESEANTEGETLEEKEPDNTEGSDEENTDSDEDESLQAFLKEKGYADEAEDSDDKAKPDSSDTPKALTEDDVERLYQERRAAERELENQERQRHGVRQAFEDRTGRIRRWAASKAASKESVTAEEVEGLLGEFTTHHGQSLALAKEDAAKELTDSWASMLVQAAEKHSPGISKEKFKDLPDFSAKFVEAIRKGYVPEKDVKAAKREAVLEYKAWRDGKQPPPGTEPPVGSGGKKGVAGRSPDDILDDPSSTHEERAKAFEQKHGFKPEGY